MSNSNMHREKYEMFRRDAENESISIPTRIQAYFNAGFHLIEAVAATRGIHIHNHQLLRRELEKHREVFGDKTEEVWRAFQEIENQIRPAQIYGGIIDGDKLQRTQVLFEAIERLCG